MWPMYLTPCPNVKDFLSENVMTVTVRFVEIDQVLTFWVILFTYGDPRMGSCSLSLVPFHLCADENPSSVCLSPGSGLVWILL